MEVTLKQKTNQMPTRNRRICVGLAIFFAMVVAFGAGIMMSSSDGHQPRMAHSKTVVKPSTRSTHAATSALPADEEPTGETKSIKVGEVFQMVYPKSWTVNTNPDGVKDGSDGEVNFIADNGALISFRSLKAETMKSLYGNDPAGVWKTQVCPGRASNKMEKSIKFGTPADLTMTFNYYPCDGVDNYLWDSPGRLIVSATDGPDGEQPVEPVLGTIQWMIDHGTP